MHKNSFFTGQPIFSQLLSFLPIRVVSKSVHQHVSDRYYKKFKSYDHLVCMLYASLQRCTSLREVTTGLMACQGRLAHLGISHVTRRSTLSDANRNRPEGFFASVYTGLYQHYFGFSPDSRLGKGIDSRLFLIDSTTIRLFSEVMKGMGTKGANGKKKGGAKAHMVVKAQEDVPCFALITHATRNDKDIFPHVHLPAKAIVVLDKGYNSYQQFDKWTKAGVSWVTRISDVASQQVKRRRIVSPSEKQAGVLQDDLVTLGRISNANTLKITVRRITFLDQQSGKTFVFITNHHHFKPSVIAGIYKRRWQIELLFKRLKQNYPLRYFLGDTENAIKIQIWCSLITDLLLKIVSKHLKRHWSFSNISGMIRLHLMNYLHLIEFLNNPEKTLQKERSPSRQLKLYIT